MPKIERTTIPKKLREYTEAELVQFNRDIQRFYKDGILNWDELGVAYGAYVRRPGAFGSTYYLAAKSDISPTRHEQYINLMRQWSNYFHFQDMKKEFAIAKQDESLVNMANEQFGGLQTSMF